MEHTSTILIVDDEPAGRETLDALLFLEGYQLAFAVNGPEALMKASYLVPDLILLDVMMPGMDGYEVCRRLRADPLLAEVPVIMLTALDDRESRLRGIEVGADDFVSKPYDRTELRARVRTITRLNRYRRVLLERTKFEWVVEHADDGYLMVSDDDVIVYANPRARLLLGLPLDQNLPIDRAFIAAACQQYRCEPREAWDVWPRPPAAGIQTPRYLVRPEAPSAPAFWLEVELIEMTSRSDERYLVRLRDVTTSVAERHMRWSFHSLVNHKLRTPLSHIVGFLEFLDRDDLSEGEKQEFLATVRRSSQVLHDRIQSIFEYMAMAGRVESSPRRCSVKEISPLAIDLSVTLGLQPCRISYSGMAGLDELFLPLARPTVELVLAELIENARKFHPTAAPALDLEIAAIDDQIRLRLADDGRTLSPEQLIRMWTPYYQCEKLFSGEVAGMGLGLASVAARVWSAGGTCRAYNRTDRPGLVVELTLPRSPAGRAEQFALPDYTPVNQV